MNPDMKSWRSECATTGGSPVADLMPTRVLGIGESAPRVAVVDVIEGMVAQAEAGDDAAIMQAARAMGGARHQGVPEDALAPLSARLRPLLAALEQRIRGRL